MSGGSLLDIKNLKTSFRMSDGVVQAVRGVDLAVGGGEFLGIVGESGCGKSVTMLSVMGLLPENAAIKADVLAFGGKDLLRASPRETRSIRGGEIGMIFQDPMTSLDPLCTIGSQLAEPLRIHRKMSAREAERASAEMLETVGISSPTSRLRQYPHEFSGGMRQRVMIAIAMSCNPKLLIADEPTTALDVTIQAQILELMKDMKEKSGTAMVLITHDLGVIASVCSRVVVMYGGLVMEEGECDDIFYRPLHPYTKGLLASISGMESGAKEKLVSIPGSPPDLMNPPGGCPFAARCAWAMKICVAAMPRLANAGGHSAACWLLRGRRAA
jgi:oligopeptide transport system ATP-binding protein